MWTNLFLLLPRHKEYDEKNESYLTRKLNYSYVIIGLIQKTDFLCMTV